MKTELMHIATALDCLLGDMSELGDFQARLERAVFHQNTGMYEPLPTPDLMLNEAGVMKSLYPYNRPAYEAAQRAYDRMKARINMHNASYEMGRKPSFETLEQIRENLISLKINIQRIAGSAATMAQKLAA